MKKTKTKAVAPPIEEDAGPMSARIKLAEIRLDGGTQPRATLEESVIADYQEAITDGEKFPPVDLFFDGESYWLADGFHRVKATERAGLSDIDALIHMGTREDAQWFSYAANKAHGLRRSNADKQRAVQAALRHPEGAKKSDHLIAEHVGVDRQTVTNWRKKMTGEIRQSPERIGRDGRAYAMGEQKKDTLNNQRTGGQQGETAMSGQTAGTEREIPVPSALGSHLGQRSPSSEPPPTASTEATVEAAPAPPAAIPHLVPTSDGLQPAAEHILNASINLRDWARRIVIDPISEQEIAAHIAHKYYRSEAERTFRSAADRLTRIADLIALASDDGRPLAEKCNGRAENILEQIVAEDRHVNAR